MAKKISASQLKSKLRQIENKNKQAIRNINRAIDKGNQAVRHFVNEYNRAARAHNAQVQRNRTNIRNLQRRLMNVSAKSSVQLRYRTSVQSMQTSYEKVVRYSDHAEGLTPVQEYIYDLIDREQENSLNTAAVFLGEQEPYQISEHDNHVSQLLLTISKDLSDRWQGAVYALNPHNPDATRQFCTSAREIFTQTIDAAAPDAVVIEYDPNCDRTDQRNTPTRRAKIAYLMAKKGLGDDSAQFADDDISNILELFHVLSDGTHGVAGKYTMDYLRVVKKRVEDGISFLCQIAA